MIRYLNTKLNGTTETIDSLDSSDYLTTKEFRQEQRRLTVEYNMAGGFGDLYWSQRCTNDYK